MNKSKAENVRTKRAYLTYLREAEGKDEKSLDKVSTASKAGSNTCARRGFMVLLMRCFPSRRFLPERAGSQRMAFRANPMGMPQRLLR